MHQSEVETIEAVQPELVAQTVRERAQGLLARRRPIWVHSKSQPPYEFHPWANPCVPHEWPYDLQALRGTEDYADIIEWYFRKHPLVPREDLLCFESELARCVGERLQISVEVYNDIDTGRKELEFTVWGFSPEVYGRDSIEIRTFYDVWFSTPALAALWQVVGVSVGYGRFEQRHRG